MRLVVHRLLNQFPLLGLLLIVSGVFGQQSPADSTTRSIKLADIQTEYEKVILEIPLILKKYKPSKEI